MCLGAPGRIVELLRDRPGLARVELDGLVRDVDLTLLDGPNPAVGDWVLVHLGFALERLSPEDANETLATISLLHDAEPRPPRQDAVDAAGSG